MLSYVAIPLQMGIDETACRRKGGALMEIGEMGNCAVPSEQCHCLFGPELRSWGRLVPSPALAPALLDLQGCYAWGWDFLLGRLPGSRGKYRSRYVLYPYLGRPGEVKLSIVLTGRK